MASQQLTGSQQTSFPLDGYLKGIKDEFDRLNHELEEARKQRDEYITKYKSHVKELRELRETISCRECQYCIAQTCGVTDDNPSPLISPISSSSDYYSSLEEGDDVLKGDESNRNETSVPTFAGTASASLSLKSIDSAWGVEFNTDTRVALQLNLLHKLTQKEGICLAFSMDGKYLATVSTSGIACVFDSKTGKIISVMKDLYEESLFGYRCLVFSPDSKYLATGELGGKVRIWIVSQRRVRNIFRHASGTVHALNFSRDGRCIATVCSRDKTVRIWRLRDGSSRVLSTSQIFPRSIRFSTDERYIASGSNSGEILIWEVRTGKMVANWKGHPDVVMNLVFTPDGEGLLSASWDNRVIHWDVASLRSFGLANPQISGMGRISCLSGHTSYVYTISISPDGKWIASGSFDKTVRIWDAHATLHCIVHCPGEVRSVDFSPVGNSLAIGGNFDDVVIWNYADL